MIREQTRINYNFFLADDVKTLAELETVSEYISTNYLLFIPNAIIVA